ncbi:MAG: DUF4349 domain-containing protein [Actinomycetota bacterium]|nr:DUF4349 domain-containing protein [Actinomycetota bacterium]
MRQVRLGSRLRVSAALAVGLLTAGGIVAAVTQSDGDDRASSVHVDESSASLEGLDVVAGGTVEAEPQAAMSMRSAVAAGSGGGGETAQASSAPNTTVLGDSALPQAGPSDPNGPRIVKRADIRVEVKSEGFRDAFQRASSIASAHGGFVASSTSQTSEGDEQSASGTVLLRVPATAFDAVRTELAGLGKVKGEVIDGEDVGGQLVDLEARIRSLQVEEETLRTLMTKAKTVGETIEVQQQLTRVRQQIEQAAGQRARLQDATALGTIRVNLFEPGAQPTEEPGKPNPIAEGARDAVDASFAVIGGTLLVLGYVLPLALLALLAWALWRLATRRNDQPAIT